MSHNLPLLAFYAGFTCEMNDLAGSFIRKGFSSSVKGTKDT